MTLRGLWTPWRSAITLGAIPGRALRDAVYIWLRCGTDLGINFPIMDSDARPHTALHAALARLLRPLFRLLLRHQVSFLFLFPVPSVPVL